MLLCAVVHDDMRKMMRGKDDERARACIYAMLMPMLDMR